MLFKGTKTILWCRLHLWDTSIPITRMYIIVYGFDLIDRTPSGSVLNITPPLCPRYTICKILPTPVSTRVCWVQMSLLIATQGFAQFKRWAQKRAGRMCAIVTERSKLRDNDSKTWSVDLRRVNVIWLLKVCSHTARMSNKLCQIRGAYKCDIQCPPVR